MEAGRLKIEILESDDPKSFIVRVYTEFSASGDPIILQKIRTALSDPNDRIGCCNSLKRLEKEFPQFQARLCALSGLIGCESSALEMGRPSEISKDSRHQPSIYIKVICPQDKEE